MISSYKSNPFFPKLFWVTVSVTATRVDGEAAYVHEWSLGVGSLGKTEGSVWEFMTAWGHAQRKHLLLHLLFLLFILELEVCGNKGSHL